MPVTVQITGSTKIRHNLSREEALNLGGHLAGYCSSESTIDDILAEDPRVTAIKRNITLNNGHHSVFGHATYLLDIQGPKFLMMLLNARRVMNTSEKSARYTQMELNNTEQPLYTKWLDIFENKILEEYPNMEERSKGRPLKLAQENARLLSSVFTPTKMGYTIDFRELNGAIYEFKQFIENAENTSFNLQAKRVMREFINDAVVQSLYEPKLNPSVKGSAGLQFIHLEQFPREQFGTVYSLNYQLSLAALAQTHRHRSIGYRMRMPEGKQAFFVPPIIKDDKTLIVDWLTDMNTVADNFPQGMMVEVNERGEIEAFITKAYERLCGSAQLEIMENTKTLAQKLYTNINPTDQAIGRKIAPLLTGPRCTFSGGCPGDNCYFGPKQGVNRKI